MNWLETIANVKLPPLAEGGHDSPRGGLCAMEMVAYLERLPHSDKPDCTCPVIAAYVRGLNDLLPDKERNRLLPYLSRLVGTVAPEFERERGEYLAWAAITIFAPAALRAAKLFEHADALANFDKTLGLEKAAAWAACAESAAWVACAESAAWAASAARAARAACAARAARAACAAIYDDCFRVLDGLLAIGPAPREFRADAPVRELCELAP